MSWIIAIIALLGAYLNVRGKWQGFVFWLISNAYWCVHDYMIGEYAQASLFAIFWLLSLYGIYRWRKETTAEARLNKAKQKTVSLCRRILSSQKSLNHSPGRIRINWLLSNAREILELLGDDNDNP